MSAFILYFICYFAIPMWMIAGVMDWFCHRMTSIHSNSGWRESIIHSIMLLEMGIPIFLSLFFEINALIFFVSITAWLIHEATAMWDVSYAHKRRYLSPFEQHMHSFLELTPFLILSLLATLHWQQFLALFGTGPASPDFRLRWKYQPLSNFYLIAVLCGVVVLQVIPYSEELWRCGRYARALNKKK